VPHQHHVIIMIIATAIIIKRCLAVTAAGRRFLTAIGISLAAAVADAGTACGGCDAIAVGLPNK
jgi:hypothetical protein